MSFIGKEKMKMWLKSKVAFPVMAITGLIVMILIIKLQPSMKHKPVKNVVTPVNYIQVKPYLIEPEIIGYGVINVITKGDCRSNYRATLS